MAGMHVGIGAHVDGETPISHATRCSDEFGPYVVVRLGEPLRGVDVFVTSVADLDRIEATVQAARADLTAAIEADNERTSKTFEALAVI